MIYFLLYFKFNTNKIFNFMFYVYFQMIFFVLIKILVYYKNNLFYY